LNPLKPVCGATKLASGLLGRGCELLSKPGTIISAGKKLVTGHVGSAVKTVLGKDGGATASAAVGLAAIVAWVLVGAKVALHQTAKVIDESTSPQLGASWFSSAYWRMAGIAALLTLPFLFAAAVQALIRSDLTLLARATFGYLPLAMLAVGIAAPLTTLLLAASDQMSGLIAAASGDSGTRFLMKAGTAVGLLSVFSGSPFLALLVGMFAAAGALVLWLELLTREAAVYVVVLMLPLAFAAMVWPARRTWAIRAVEVLVALILAKFAIVAVLALAGAALDHRGSVGVAGSLAGAVLVLLGAFAPWALLRLLPLSELASAAAGPLRGELSPVSRRFGSVLADEPADWARTVTAGMRRQADESREAGPHDDAATHGAQSEAARLAELAAGPVGAAASTAAGGADPPAARPDAIPPAASSPEPAQSTAVPPERSPGMDAIWQQPDLSWRTLYLDLEGLPDGPLWEPPPPEGGGPDDGPPDIPMPPAQPPDESPL
jgi:hypothetical protein